MTRTIKNIAVIGDGGWGTTLAILLAKKDLEVSLWGAFPDYVQTMRRTRENHKFLPGIKIPVKIQLQENLSHAVHPADLIILAVPSQFMASILDRLKTLKLKNKYFLSVVKGIDPKNLLRMSQVIKKYLGSVSLAVLSGPNIASEVVRGIPSTAVIASKNNKLAKALQILFNSNTFRIYTNKDVAGVELGGSLKNIIAIACGVCDGLGYGTNTKSAILTRGLAEMVRLGVHLGAKEKTFFGLSGLGDLTTTCFSLKSRNRGVGEQLGRGLTIKKIKQQTEMIAEGVETVKAVHQLMKKHRIPMPISSEVYKIIYQNKKPGQAVSALMGRQVKAE